MKLDTTNAYGYDIMTALRGPDGPTSDMLNSVKYMFTGVLRYFAGVQGVSYAVTASPNFAVDHYTYGLDDDQREAVRKYWVQNVHFASHIVAGFSALLHEFHIKDKDKYIELKDYLDWLKERGLYV